MEKTLNKVLMERNITKNNKTFLYNNQKFYTNKF